MSDVKPATDEQMGQMRAVVDGEYLPSQSCLWYHDNSWDDLAIVMLIARIEQEVEGRTQDRAEIERLKEVIHCKDVLLTAYRLGTNRGVDKALSRLAEITRTAGGKDEKE